MAAAAATQMLHQCPSQRQVVKTHWWPSTILTDTKHHGRGFGKRAEACSARKAAARPVRNTRVLCVVAVGARARFLCGLQRCAVTRSTASSLHALCARFSADSQPMLLLIQMFVKLCRSCALFCCLFEVERGHSSGVCVCVWHSSLISSLSSSSSSSSQTSSYT